jgi:hypothetical protein
MKRRKYNHTFVEDEESISDMLSEELDIDSDDEMNLENGQSTSEELSNTLESECDSETSVVLTDGCEDMAMGNKLKAYTFT